MFIILDTNHNINIIKTKKVDSAINILRILGLGNISKSEFGKNKYIKKSIVKYFIKNLNNRIF